MKITVFTSSACSWCVQLKKYLKFKNLTYEEVNIEENPERAQEPVKLTGMATLPVTLVEKDGVTTPIVGYNLVKLSGIIN